MNIVQLVAKLRIVKEKLPLNFYLNKRASYFPISSYCNNCVNWTEKTQSARHIQPNQLCFHQHQTSQFSSLLGVNGISLLTLQPSFTWWYPRSHYVFFYPIAFFSHFFWPLCSFFFFSVPSLISHFNNCSSLWRLQVNWLYHSFQ